MKRYCLLICAVFAATWPAIAQPGPGKPKVAKADKAPAAKPTGRMVNGHYMLFDKLDSLRVWKILPRATPPQGAGC